MFKTLVLIIIVCVQGQPETVTDHKFNSMESCIKARNEAMNIPFRFNREVNAFCVEK